VSANTDGVVFIPNESSLFEPQVAIDWWEETTGFKTEETEYTALYSKDVNNYIAVKTDGTTKLKGLYAPAGMQKNNTNEICVEAAIAFLTKDTPLEQTIYECQDVRKFVTIRQVKGGGVYGGQYLGKVVRWYYAVNETRHVEYATNGNKVAKSDGSRPLMELPAVLPIDIDYQWYIDEAKSILSDVGM
jgi:hypothetical protein